MATRGLPTSFEIMMVVRQVRIRTVSEYCSARVSHVGLSTKQATEPYSDNLLNRTRNPSEPSSDKEIPPRRALRRFAFLFGLLTGNPPKIGTFTAWNRTRNRTRTLSEELGGSQAGTLETGTLSLSAKRDAHFSEGWQVVFLPQRGPAFFLPFSSLVAAF